uniref:Uncharacterized protein n=1 Tax=Peronospora matthiolae TaxID=2874970 RepID=A0AAV1TLA2_9STRA
MWVDGHSRPLLVRCSSAPMFVLGTMCLVTVACTHFRKGADDVYIASDPTTTATDTTAAHRIPTTSSHSELKMYLSHLAALNAVSQYLHVAAD